MFAKGTILYLFILYLSCIYAKAIQADVSVLDLMMVLAVILPLCNMSTLSIINLAVLP